MSLLDKEKYTEVKCMDICSSAMANMSSAAVVYVLLKIPSKSCVDNPIFKTWKNFISCTATSLAPWLAC